MGMELGGGAGAGGGGIGIRGAGIQGRGLANTQPAMGGTGTGGGGSGGGGSGGVSEGGGGGGNYSNTLSIALTNSDRTTLSQLKARQRIVEKQQSGTNLSLTLTLNETQPYLT